MLNSDKAALVYFSTEKDKPDIEFFMKFSEKHGHYVNTVWFQVSDVDDLKKNFKSAAKALPSMRTFRNGLTGATKRDQS